MMRNPPWPSARLGEVAQIQTGLAKGKQPEEGKGVPAPYLRVANVQDGHVDLTELKTIIVEPQALQRYALQDGDVLFTEGGDADKLGRGCVWRAQVNPCLHQNHIFAVRAPRDVLLPSFLAAYAAGPLGKNYFLGCAKRTTNLASINSTQLRNFPVPIPPLDEQRKIAAILSSVDDAIEATQAVIDQLQVVKKAMMAELLMRGLPGRHSRFKNSDIGEVPVEWEVVTLGTLLLHGPDNGLYKPQSDYGAGTPIVRIDAFSNGERLSGDDLRRVRASDEEIRRFYLREGDILINRVNSLSHLGKVGFVGALSEPTVFESNMMRLAVDPERILPSFAFLILASPMTKSFFLQRAKQAVAQASINQQDVCAASVPLPTVSEQAAISSAIENTDMRLTAEYRYLELLAALKNELLRVLLTGEIRVTPDETAP